MPDESTRARGRPSIYDVAARAGVSHMTVSRVINGQTNIREATRERVLQAIAELGYQPSSTARALASGQSRRIGVIVDAAEHYGPKNTLLAIERAAREVGFAVEAFSISGHQQVTAATALSELAQHEVDAICMIAPRLSSLGTLSGRAVPVPTIVVGDYDGDASVRTVAVDQGAGSAMVVDHLAELGHRSVLHLAGPLDWLDALARESAWRRAMDARGLDAQLLVGDWSSDFGYEVGASHPLIDEVTAVFASNDQMALGLMHGLWTRGIRVPDDMSVVGYDDSPESRHFLPPLTTVRQDFAALGEAAMRAVLDAVERRDVPHRQRVEPEFVIRESTAAPRSGGAG
ncbi:LacI family transcriptional regulator [Microbacterium sp. 4R-513]|uniref:LacI family DNA-binding transcriptional regulator n=1 Tax=Microbacterium sp. 4R-513 TaxID=2567934 RepID=UPI0013E10704|nr:LacI family DNA-binding transcriptional regulator [Microbacterium sp. 4R-513]QIG38720.1 LacI family transcriptional regulator [Microbacterium sp. 4R-513]